MRDSEMFGGETPPPAHSNIEPSTHGYWVSISSGWFLRGPSYFRRTLRGTERKARRELARHHQKEARKEANAQRLREAGYPA